MRAAFILDSHGLRCLDIPLTSSTVSEVEYPCGPLVDIKEGSCPNHMTRFACLEAEQSV